MVYTMKIAGKQIVNGYVLDTRRTTKGNGAMINVQIMGGAPESTYVADEEDLKFQEGDLIECAIAFKPYGQGEEVSEKGGKTFTNRFPTFRMYIDVVADAATIAARGAAPRPRAAA